MDEETFVLDNHILMNHFNDCTNGLLLNISAKPKNNNTKSRNFIAIIIFVTNAFDTSNYY